MNSLNSKSLRQAVFVVSGFAIFLLIGVLIGSMNPQTKPVESSSSPQAENQGSEINAPGEERKTASSVDTQGKLCRKNQRELVNVVRDALKSQYPGIKIIKIGHTQSAEPNPDATTMGGSVVASCQTDIYASIGGKYPVDWNIEADGNQYYVATGPLLNSTQKKAFQELEDNLSDFEQEMQQAVSEFEQEIHQAEQEGEDLLKELSRDLCAAGIESEC